MDNVGAYCLHEKAGHFLFYRPGTATQQTASLQLDYSVKLNCLLQ